MRHVPDPAGALGVPVGKPTFFGGAGDFSNQPRVRRQYSLSSGIRPGCRAHDRRGAEAQQEQETLANRHLLTNSSRCLHAGCFFWGGLIDGVSIHAWTSWIYETIVCVCLFSSIHLVAFWGSFFQAIFTYRKLQKNENVKSYEKYCSIFLGLLEIHKVTSDSYSAAETFATEEIDLHLLVLQSNSMDRLMTFSFHFMIIVNGFNSLENGPRTFGARKRPHFWKHHSMICIFFRNSLTSASPRNFQHKTANTPLTQEVGKDPALNIITSEHVPPPRKNLWILGQF